MKKSNVSLSLDAHLLEDLRIESDQLGISLNSKINIILEKYALFYSETEKQKSMVMPAETFVEVLAMISEGEVVKLIETLLTEIIPSFFDDGPFIEEYTLDDVIKLWFEQVALWLGLYSSFKHYKDMEGHLFLAFEHKFGMKWSRILQTAFCSFVENRLKLPVNSRIRDNSVIIITKARGNN